MLYQQANGNTENAIILEFDANDKLHFKLFQVDNSTARIVRHTTQVFRDTSAWMDIHIAFNTGLTTDNCCKIHINGAQITAFDTKTNTDSARDHGFLNSSKPLYWFGNAGGLSGYSYTARALIQDGAFGAPGDVAETTGDGFWQINSASDLTFGNHGLLLEGQNISTGTDSQDGGTATEAETSLLLHFDGNDAATTSTDSSSYNHTPTFVGNAQLDTAQKKFGTSSLLLDGNGDYVTIPDHHSLELGTGNFTISFQVYFNTIHTKNATFTNMMMGKYTGSSVGWLLTYANGTHLTFYSGAAGAVLSTSFSLSTGQWYHMEISRSGTAVKWFVNGVERSSATSSVNLNGPSKLLWLGVESTTYQATDRDLDGFIDEVKIIKGSAAHTSGFTAPSAAHTDPATANHFTKVGTITATNDSPTNGDDS